MAEVNDTVNLVVNNADLVHPIELDQPFRVQTVVMENGTPTDKLDDEERGGEFVMEIVSFPHCSPQQEEAVPGRTARVTFEGLLPNREIHALLGPVLVLEGVSTDAKGNGAIDLPIPADTPPGPHLVTIGHDGLALTAECTVNIAARPPKEEKDIVVSVAAAAGGSITPSQKRDAKIGATIRNGDFLIERTGNESTLGNGRDEDTIWRLDFTKDPNWASFRDGVDQRGLRSALLTLALIPKGKLISTDTLQVGDLPAIGANKKDGGESPFVFPPFQELPLDIANMVEIELLSFYTPEEVLSIPRGSPEGQVPIRFGDDAIVVFAHLKLIPGCTPGEVCPTSPEQPEPAAP